MDTTIPWSGWTVEQLSGVKTKDFHESAKVVKAQRTWKGASETRWYIVSTAIQPEYHIDETYVFPCMFDDKGLAVANSMQEVAGVKPHSFHNAIEDLLEYLGTIR